MQPTSYSFRSQPSFLAIALLSQLLLAWSFLGVEKIALGQQPPPANQETDSLLEGLLDEAMKPAEKDSSSNPTKGESSGKTAENPQKNSSDQESTTPDGQPSDAGSSLGGDNPLDLIRMGMLAASSYLRQGRTDQQTQGVQKNIIERLDDLILQAESAAQQEQKSRSESGQSEIEQSQSAQQQQQQQQNQNRREQNRQGEPAAGDQKNGEEQGGDPDKGDPQATSNTPGMKSGEGKKTTVQPEDPKALQQGVWGHLPEKIRQQMMSRMVEKFLPKYEGAIQDYFRDLADEDE